MNAGSIINRNSHIQAEINVNTFEMHLYGMLLLKRIRNDHPELTQAYSFQELEKAVTKYEILKKIENNSLTQGRA